MRAVPLVLATLVTTGCFGLGGGEEEPWYPTTRPTPASPPPQEPLFFGGVVIDTLTGEPVADASVRIDLAQTRPCRNQGLGWSSWEPPVAEDGSWGPFEIARPRSDEVAFFVHVFAPGYAENTTYVGFDEARGDLANLTFLMHRDAAIEGVAAPGTIVALDAPGFPRFTAANESGGWRFDQARVVPATLVIADVDAPVRTEASAPGKVEANATTNRTWLLQGVLRTAAGAPLAADVAAWNGTKLWSAGRAGENGLFVLPLPPEPVTLRIEARTQGNAYGAVRVLEVNGAPAVREALIARSLC